MRCPSGKWAPLVSTEAMEQGQLPSSPPNAASSARTLQTGVSGDRLMLLKATDSSPMKGLAGYVHNSCFCVSVLLENQQNSNDGTQREKRLG